MQRVQVKKNADKATRIFGRYEKRSDRAVQVVQFLDISSINKQVAGASSRSLAAVRSYSVITDLTCRSGTQMGHGTV
ncbi:MAG: hypothetical protein WAM89_04625 [Terriglobales bacterium]